MSHLMNTYARLPVAFVRGEGVWLYDEQGKPYLDALAGIAVSTLGHGHPRLVEAIARQAKAVIHTSNLYRIPAQERLADRLCELSGMDEVFFGNSGAEANECAIKLARFYGHKVKGVETPKIAVMEQAFHGRTLATLSATGNKKTQAGFEPLVEGFIRVPFGDAAALTKVLAETPDLVAVMFEVVQGEGGIRLADPEYLRAVRALCDAHGLLMICDEVQCGLGRTGKWFGWQWSEVRPDVMTLAKGLGSGVPIGACLAAGPAAGLFGPGNHGSTFGGNPLACTAGLTTLDVIETDALLDNAARVGGYLKATLTARLAHLAQIKGVRGLGLMLGVELDRPCGALVLDALEAGLLINVTAERVIRLLPPLILTIEEAQQIVERLVPLVERFVARH
ncbi:aspartate aminotransferase family protein [Tepidiphilus baoligensis]|uniref:Acetylornithine aminotransferase n=1 Tax=Tepidiphilus baoligensis TaxID=2698687 RepID=A0ABX1QKX5_9PROT|nr:aspartate aminotransferase family protein [Tepidiphilus baoligensis]NMH15849.1 acetylornithine/succinylornithine family transaminase [Tepidiphilus baoligensis]